MQNILSDARCVNGISDSHRLIIVQQSVSRLAGGLFFSVRKLAISLKAESFISPVVMGVCDKYSEEDISAWEDVPVIIERGVGILRGFSPSLVIRFFRTANKNDILYQNGIWSPVSIISRLALVRGIKFMVAPRGMLDPYILKKNTLLKRIFLYFIESRLLEGAHTVHALTKKEADQIKAVAPGAQVFICPNGVDFKLLNRPESSTGETRFLFIGRLDPKKRLIELVEAFSELGKRTTSDWRLHIHGWGSREYVSMLSKAIDASDMRERIVLLEPVYGEKKAAALAACHFFILPSVSEGLPMAALEALAAGRALIATSECNLDSSVVASSGCLLLDEDDWVGSLEKSLILMDDGYTQAVDQTFEVARKIYDIEITNKRMSEYLISAFCDKEL